MKQKKLSPNWSTHNRAAANSSLADGTYAGEGGVFGKAALAGTNILVVEDEPALAELLEQALRESGYSVSLAATGREGVRKAPGHDLLIVDVMLPLINGFEMVRILRKEGNRNPVLFLTAKDGPMDLIQGLDLGGDAYVTKPFRLNELLAQIRALVRRSRECSDELCFGGYALNRRTRKLFYEALNLPMSLTEVALVELFFLRAGEVISKSAILREIWDDEGYRGPNVVEVYVNYLRKKLETGGRPRLIHTVRGEGYVLKQP